MIGRLLMNWIPLAPMLVVGVFLLLVGTTAWLSTSQTA